MKYLVLSLLLLAMPICYPAVTAVPAAGGITNLVTVCTSAKALTQAAKCTAWAYNYFSAGEYIESYPTVTPAPSGINDPNYAYRLGSSLTQNSGVKVCPTALIPGVSFASTTADPCPGNRLAPAGTAAGWSAAQLNYQVVFWCPGGTVAPTLALSAQQPNNGAVNYTVSVNYACGPVSAGAVLSQN